MPTKPFLRQSNVSLERSEQNTSHPTASPSYADVFSSPPLPISDSPSKVLSSQVAEGSLRTQRVDSTVVSRVPDVLELAREKMNEAFTAIMSFSRRWATSNLIERREKRHKFNQEEQGKALVAVTEREKSEWKSPALASSVLGVLKVPSDLACTIVLVGDCLKVTLEEVERVISLYSSDRESPEVSTSDYPSSYFTISPSNMAVAQSVIDGLVGTVQRCIGNLILYLNRIVVANTLEDLPPESIKKVLKDIKVLLCNALSCLCSLVLQDEKHKLSTNSVTISHAGSATEGPPDDEADLEDPHIPSPLVVPK